VIEDSLKNARNLHRLIMLLSFITLIFSLSLKPPLDKRLQRKQIESLISFNFSKYDEFVNQKVNERMSVEYAEISSFLAESINKYNHLIFNVNSISELFDESPHVGKLLIEELILVSPANASLNQLTALNGLSLAKDVQIVVLEIKEIAPLIETFLQENNSPIGRRVDNAYLEIEDYSFIAETFLPREEIRVNLYFELPERIRIASSPVFSESFNAKVISIPRTSFISWLSEQPMSNGFSNILDETVIWIPSMEHEKNEFKEKRLGLLVSELKIDRDIEKSLQEVQKVSFLGASIPGLVYVYTAPILLIAFCYYLKNYVQHLLELSTDQDRIKQVSIFSWIPLMKVSYWKVDFFLTSCFLPIASMLVLYFQINQFGDVGILRTSLITACIIMCIVLTGRMYSSLIEIRKNIHQENLSLTRKFSRCSKLRR